MGFVTAAFERFTGVVTLSAAVIYLNIKKEATAVSIDVRPQKTEVIVSQDNLGSDNIWNSIRKVAAPLSE